MINPDGSPQTAHTTNLVPMIYVAEDADQYELADGKLADIAPTMLGLLGLEAPAEMDRRAAADEEVRARLRRGGRCEGGKVRRLDRLRMRNR